MGDAARKLDEETRASNEQRLDSRVVPRASVHVSVDLFSEHNFWTGLTMNVSEGGVFVATHAAVPIGTMLVLHLQLPGSDEPIVTLAEVRWTRAFTDQDDVPPGLGLQFVALDKDGFQRVRRFVSSMRDPLFFDDE